MSDLRISGLAKTYGAVDAIRDVELTVTSGEFFTLLGPSGCGKSTTLSAVAGLDRPTAGRISVGDLVYFDGTSGRYLPPERRDCGMVFQSYALWPHMTIRRNLEFPLKLRKLSRAERTRRIDEALGLVELTGFEDRLPAQLSGGQQQRVALARAIVYQPRLLLLDEPLSNLDAQIRERARKWLKDMHSRLNMTTLYVTHDQIEALSLSDRIGVMEKGRLVQVGTPDQIYRTPATAFVAEFIGTSNFLSGRMDSDAGRVALRLEDGQILVLPDSATQGEGDLTAVFRPESIAIGHGPGSLNGNVVDVAYLGERYEITLTLAGQQVRLYDRRAPGTACVQFRIEPEDLRLLQA